MLKAAAALISACGVPAVLHQLKKRESLTILSLHRVSPETDYFWQPLHPKRFDELCAYVKRHYQVINLRDLPQHFAPAKPLLVLSFDDGYHDFIEYALPVLHRHNLPANHNLVVACLDSNYIIWSQRLNYSFNQSRIRNIPLGVTIGVVTYTLQDFGQNWMKFYLHVFKKLLTQPMLIREAILVDLEQVLGETAQVRMMNWAEARALPGHNIEIGSHTYFHDVVPTITDAETLRQEIIISRQLLAERLGQPIAVLGLPNGQNDAHLQSAIQEAGYDYVLETGDRGNASYRRPSTGPACFNRINIVDESLAITKLRVAVLSLR